MEAASAGLPEHAQPPFDAAAATSTPMDTEEAADPDPNAAGTPEEPIDLAGASADANDGEGDAGDAEQSGGPKAKGQMRKMQLREKAVDAWLRGVLRKADASTPTGQTLAIPVAARTEKQAKEGKSLMDIKMFVTRIGTRSSHHRALSPQGGGGLVPLIDQQSGLLCPLCARAPRRCLRPDELFAARCVDPRALALPMTLHAHVLTASLPLPAGALAFGVAAGPSACEAARRALGPRMAQLRSCDGASGADRAWGRAHVRAKERGRARSADAAEPRMWTCMRSAVCMCASGSYLCPPMGLLQPVGSGLLRVGCIYCRLPGLLHDLAMCDVACALLCRGPKAAGQRHVRDHVSMRVLR